eukprot:1462207-Amphidinium_carterae.1
MGEDKGCSYSKSLANASFTTFAAFKSQSDSQTVSQGHMPLGGRVRKRKNSGDRLFSSQSSILTTNPAETGNHYIDIA